MATKFEAIKLTTKSGTVTLPDSFFITGVGMLPTGYALAYIYETPVTGTVDKTFVAMELGEVGDFNTSVASGMIANSSNAIYLATEQDSYTNKVLVVLN
jgi:hypothetical protein